MSTNVTRLKNQLAESRKVCEGLNEQLKSNPDDTILPIRIKAMEERVDELKKNIKQAEADERRTAMWNCVYTVANVAVKFVDKKIPKLKWRPVAVCGLLANSDFILDEIVEKSGDDLLVCNADSLLRIVQRG
jgi:hypothetical protein